MFAIVFYKQIINRTCCEFFYFCTNEKMQENKN